MASQSNASNLEMVDDDTKEKRTSALKPKRPEKQVAAKKKPRQFRSRKPKDMPRRPLSAYNIFFKEERAKLLADRQEKGAAAGEKIGFEKMAKTIGRRWKELSGQDLERFKLLARNDTERYRREMDAYNHELAMKGRREREEMSRKRMEAGIQPQVVPQHSQIAPPSIPTGCSAPPSQTARNNSADQDMGQFADRHLLSHLSGASAASAQLVNSVGNSQQQQQQQQQSVSAQLNQILGGCAIPNLQGLRGLLAGQQERSATLQDAFALGNLGQQQNQPSLEAQLRQQQHQARLEDQLRQQQQQTQSRLEEQLMQNLLNRVAANPGLMGSLPPAMQQLLLVQSLQGGNGNLLSGAFVSISSALPSGSRP